VLCAAYRHLFLGVHRFALQSAASSSSSSKQQQQQQQQQPPRNISPCIFLKSFFIMTPVHSALSHLKTLHSYSSFISFPLLCCPLHPFQMIFSCLSSGHHLALAPAGAPLNYYHLHHS
jgi:hypothetical protein